MKPFIAKCPRLLPGESEQAYHALFDMMVNEIEPQTASEWLVLADIVGLFWEIGRYRAWRGAILNVYRHDALAKALRDTHRGSSGMHQLIIAVGKEAEEWRDDPAKREVLNKRLAKHGYDEEALNACAMLAALEPLSTIERFLSSARGQLNAMMKEVYVRREFAERARKALVEQIKEARQGAEPKQIGPN
jgi:hypothetical protein